MLFLGLNRRCRRAPLYRAEMPPTAPAWVLYGSGRTYKVAEQAQAGGRPKTQSKTIRVRGMWNAEFTTSSRRIRPPRGHLPRHAAGRTQPHAPRDGRWADPARAAAAARGDQRGGIGDCSAACWPGAGSPAPPPPRSPHRLVLVHHGVEPLGEARVAPGAGVGGGAAASRVALGCIGPALQQHLDHPLVPGSGGGHQGRDAARRVRRAVLLGAAATRHQRPDQGRVPGPRGGEQPGCQRYWVASTPSRSATCRRVRRSP